MDSVNRLVILLFLCWFISGCSIDRAAPSLRWAPTGGVTAPTVVPIPDPIATSRELSLASPVSLSNWDVHLSPSPALASWGPGIVYSRLLRFRSGPGLYEQKLGFQGVPNTLIECDVCDSWERIDSTTYIFKLREDVYWQNIHPTYGRQLVAQDVLLSLERQRASGNPNARILASIRSIEVLNEHALKFELKSSDSDIFFGLASGFTKIVPPEVINIKGHIRDGPVVGSGPWIWEGTRGNMGYFFKANSTYYEPGLPKVDRLNIITLLDYQTRLVAFRFGKIDIIESAAQDFHSIRNAYPDLESLLYRQSGVGLEFVLNTEQPPFDNLMVRKALFHSMDPWESINLIWGGLGYVSQGMLVADPGWFLPDEELRTYLDDPIAARQLLESIGVEYPTDFILTVADFGDRYLEYGNHVVKRFEALGFHPTIRVVNPMDYPDKVWYGKDYQAFLGPIAPMDSPNMYFMSVLHGGGIWNTHGYDDPVLNDMIDDQVNELDLYKRQELVLEIQRYVMDKAVRFMPVTHMSAWLWWPHVRGFYPNLTSAEYLYLAEVSSEDR